MKIKAYAKINLTLDITGIRDDGFHSLRSVMVPVSLCDEIEINESDSFSFDCNIKELCSEDNLCVRAAKLFFATSGINALASLRLTKNIPFPAGLGGGSSDAAAVLRGLNGFFSSPLEETELFKLAESLGSDVPLCLLSRPALCEGRGEILTPIESLPSFDIVIAIGDGRLPTPTVYREYDAEERKVRNDTDLLLERLNCDRYSLTEAFGNAFEEVTDKLAPETKRLREHMLALGALNSHLSGSGPSVYGVFENAEKAQIAAKSLEKMGYFAVCCKTLS